MTGTDRAAESESGRSTPASLHAQLERFATDVGELYRRQKERAEQLDVALSGLRVAYR